MAAQKVKIGTAVLEVTTDSTGVVSGLKLVDAEFDKKGKSISAKAVAMGAAVGTAIGGLAVAAVKKLGQELLEVGSRGLVMAPVVTSFHNLTAAVGESADEMLRASREGASGLIADLDLMQAGNKALLLGLPVTADNMRTMAQTAVVLGKAMNQGPTKSFDDLITALGRSSPMILDNLGLSVKVGEANEKYAASLGKTAESLTDAEKKTAFYNAAMEAAKKKVEEVGGVQLTLTARLDQIKVRMTNFTDALGVAIVKSPVLAAGLGAVADSLGEAFGGDQTQLVQTLMSYVNDFAIQLIGVAQGAVFLARGVGSAFAGIKTIFLGVTYAVTGVVAGLGEAVEGALRLASKVPGVGSAFDGAIASVSAFNDRTRNSISELAGMTAEAAKGVVGQDAFGRSLDTVATTLSTMKARMIEAKDQQANLGGETKTTTAALEDNAEAQKKASEAAKKAAEIAEKERDALKSMGLVTDRDVNTTLEELTKLQERAVKEGVPMVAFLQAAEKRLKEMADKAKEAGLELGDLEGALADVRAELNKLNPKPMLDMPRLLEQGSRSAELLARSLQPVTAETLAAGRQAAITQQAYETLGIETQASARQTYLKFRQAYEDMARSGNATKGELEEAWGKVKEAGIAAGVETQSVWERDVLPAVRGVVDGISQSVSDGLIAMIGHWSSHKTKLKEIWDGIKQNIIDTLANVLNYFVNSFLNGMLNAILGHQAPFASAFGALFRTSGGGAGGLGTVIELTNPSSMAGAGAAAGNSFASGLASALYAGAAAYGIFKFWDSVISAWTGGESPERHQRPIGYIENPDGPPTPVMGEGIEQEEYDRRYPPGGGYQPDLGNEGPGWQYSFAKGTPRLDFKPFKWGQRARMHGMEAVIPQGSGHMLAKEIAAAMPPQGVGQSVVNHNDFRGAFFPDRTSLQRLWEILKPAEIEFLRSRGLAF
jgi:hypothetical protein